MGKLWILGSYPPPYGGVATFVKSLHENLAKEGIDHNMIVRSDRQHKGMQLLEDNIFKYLFQMCMIPKSSCIVDSCSIFLEYPQYKENVCKCLIWNTLINIRKFSWIKIFHDGTMPDRYKKLGYKEKAILKYSLKHMKKILVVNESLREWLINDIGYKGKIVLIKSILPRNYKEKTLNTNIRTFIQKYKYIIVSIGTCNKEYGFQDIIDAVAALPQYLNKVVGIILIDGNFACKNKEYLDIRKKLSEYENILLISKGMDSGKVYSIMKKSSIFIRGVCYESYGISRIEAIMAGIPVIATNTGETRGMIIYKSGDIKELSRNILNVLTGKISNNKEWISFYKNMALENYNMIKKEIM